MTRSTMRKTLLASSLCLLPGLAHALGLGTIDVKSALNEPLNAEIELVFASPAEQESLTVRLAREEDFQRVGLDASRLTVPLKFSVERGSKGKPVIRVTSDRPVKDPALTILLDVNWGAGRLLREYSILLDPPLMAPAIRGSGAVATAVAEPAPAKISEPAPAPAAVVAPAPAPVAPPAPAPAPVARAETPAPAAPAPAAPAPAAPAPAPVETAAARPAPAPAPVSTPAPEAARTYQVERGKNLLQVAREVSPGSADEMNRFMVAVLRTNPQSFYQDNVNALRGGAVLTLPTPAQIAAISQSDAAEVIRTHNDLWRQYAQAAAAQPTRLADSGTSGSTPPARPAAGAADSRLELVPPSRGDGQGAADAPGSSANAGNAEEVSRLRRDLQTRREELTSAQKELDEMRSRVRDLEGLKGKQDALIKLKDDEIAQLQARLAEINREAEAARTAAKQAEDALKTAQATPVAVAPAVPAPAIPTPEPTPEPAPVPEPEPTPEPAPAVASTDDAAADDDIWGGTEPAPAGDDTVVDAIPEPTPAVPAPAPAPPPVVTPTPEPAPEAASGGLFSLPVIGGLLGLLGLAGGAYWFTRRRKPAPAAPAFLPTGPDAAAFPDIDPVDDLRDRVALNPSDLGAHLELLRYLHGQGNAVAFGEAAEYMYRYVSNADGEEWREAAMLGADLLPDHSLFAAHEAGSESRGQDLGELDLGSLDSSPAPAAPSSDFGFEFNMDPAAAPAPVPPATSSGDTFEFDLGGATASAPAPAAPGFDFQLDGLDAPAPAPAAPPAAEFNFDLDLEGPTRRVEPVPAPTAASADADFSFDFDSLLSPSSGAAPTPEAAAETGALPDLDTLVSSLEPAAPAPAPAPADLSLDLGDLDLNFGDTPSASVDFRPVELESMVPSQAASALEQPDVIPLDGGLDLDDPSFLGDDAIATKLDLARAYIDMSDPDGARAMLEEVLLEGNDAQKSEARQILDRIG